MFVVSRKLARRPAHQLGAVWAGPPGESPPMPLRKTAITFASVGEVVLDAHRTLDRGGTCVVNAIHLGRIPEFAYEHPYRERRLLSVANFTRQDAAEFPDLARRIPVRTMVEQFPLAEANRSCTSFRRAVSRAPQCSFPRS